MPLGYGPAAKLLTVARVLRGRGVRLVLIGHGTALELAARSEQLFDDVLHAQPGDGAREAAVRSADAVLSVMDRELAQAADGAAAPLYVIDSLLWMRDAILPAFRGARRYWAQNFLGLRQVQGDYEPAPAIIGPIVSPDPPRPGRARGELLINLGGCEALDAADANFRAYADFVVAGYLESSLARTFAGRATVMAGTRCVETLAARYGARGVAFTSLPHDAALERLAGAALIFTSPGVTTLLESFQVGVPTYLLPPQSYSQWCTLRMLRAAGLAPHALHWEDLAGSPRLADRMPERERNPLVRAAIARFTADDAARSRLTGAFDAAGRAEHAAVAAVQSRFFASLGPNGALTIAEEIVDHVMSAARP
jgi:hypothetical protein